MGLLHDWKLPEGFLYTEKTVYPSFLWSPSPSHNSHNLTLLSWPQTSQSHPAYPMIPLPTDFPSSIKVLSLSRLKELANLEDPRLRHTTLWIFPFVLLCFSLCQLICPHRSKMRAFWLQDQLYCDFRRSQRSLSLVHKVHWPSSTMWLELSARLTNSQSPKLLFSGLKTACPPCGLGHGRFFLDGIVAGCAAELPEMLLGEDWETLWCGGGRGTVGSENAVLCELTSTFWKYHLSSASLCPVIW